MTKKIIFVIIISCSIFLLLELVCRLFFPFPESRFITQAAIFQTAAGKDYPQFVISDPFLFWKLKPGIKRHTIRNSFFKDFFTNEDGLRTPYSRKVTNSLQTVLCLGDSCTFGVKIPYEDCLPAQLDHLLQKKFKAARFRVINAGVPGYSSFQGMMFLSQLGWNYHPQYLIIEFCLNDRAYWNGISDSEHYWTFARRRFLDRLQFSAFFVVLRTGIRKTLYTLHTRGKNEVKSMDRKRNSPKNGGKAHHRKKAFNNEKDRLYAFKGAIPRVPLNEFKDNLRTMISLARDKKVIPLLIAWSQRGRTAIPLSKRNAYQRAVLEISAELEVPCIDLNTALPHPNDNLWLDRFHLTGEGYGYVAKALLPLIHS